MKPQKKDQLSITIGLYLAGGLAAAAILFIFVIKPQYNQATATAAQAAKVNTQIAGLNQLDKDTTLLRANYASVKSQRDQILSLLPTQSEEERLLVLLSNLAAQSGCAMSTFAPQSASTIAGAGTLGVSTSINGATVYPVVIDVSAGSYPSLEGFLVKLEKAGRFLNINSGTITTTSAANAGVTAQINLTAYYQAGTSQATTGGTQ
jgi:Tfp pilus assembly protein PilO